MINFKLKDNLSVVDIGTNKVVTINYKKSDDGTLKIFNINHKKSEGIDRSVICSQNKFNQTIKNSVLNDKNLIGSQIISSISDTQLFIKKNFKEINKRGFKVSKKDVRKIFVENLTSSVDKNMTILHSFPKTFFINGKQINKDPVGIECEKLGLGFTNLYVRNSYIKLIENAFSQSKKNKKIDFIDSGLASALSSLTHVEKTSGATAIDLGAGSVKIVTFLNDNIEFLKNIPLGGNDVTNDIQKIIDLKNEQAEFIKIINGTLIPENEEKIGVNLDNGMKKFISSNLLHGIIKPRYEEILEITRDALEENILSSSNMQKIVFTGGASSIKGFESFASNILNRNIRIAKPQTNYMEINKPEFSTVHGLMKIYNNSSLRNIISVKSWNQKLSMTEKIENWISESIN